MPKCSHTLSHRRLQVYVPKMQPVNCWCSERCQLSYISARWAMHIIYVKQLVLCIDSPDHSNGGSNSLANDCMLPKDLARKNLSLKIKKYTSLS